MIWTSTAQSGYQEGAEERPNAADRAAKVVPKLVLFMVIDGFPQSNSSDIYDQLHGAWLQAVARQGRLVRNNHYSHATTYTGVGQRRFLSCAHTLQTTGGRERWIDKKTGDVCIRLKTPGFQIPRRRNCRFTQHVAFQHKAGPYGQPIDANAANIESLT